uniref:Leucine-rich repeat extensin-like protein 4 n=1 Tax=Ananas comosus var. bracteatus TaxID=296719 RepID=A0A6V7QJ40_ANACO|nr:unnamed protein product [Ananas comosus var. bracteatus]
MRYMRQLITHQTTTFSSIPLTQRSEPNSSKGIFEKAPLLIDLIPKMMQGIGFFLLLFSSLHLSSPSALAYIVVGGGVGVWINGRGTTPTSSSSSSSTQTPPDPQNPSPMATEFAALQAWKQAITEDPVVAGIDLNGANLGGYLVRELSLLTHLNFIHLNSNRFQGTVPESFKDLQYLTELDLSSNLLAGPSPPRPSSSRAHLPRPPVQQLLRGAPEALFQKQLDAIFLNNNQFEGQIPASLWASPASVITLANNNLTGPIPASFGYSSGIRELLFLNNTLTGCIPEGVGFLAEVEVLDLSFNSLGGDIPSTLSCLSGIEVLNVAHNGLTGELPDILCELRSLANLSVSFNFFSGFGADCTRELLIRNVGFDFAGNCIPGRGMQRPPPECPGSGPGAGLSCLRTRPAGCGGTGLRVGVGIPGIPFTLSTTLPIPVP